MRFIDEATIQLTAGHGGSGCVSFRRETFAPKGGPDGGDGGDGGDIVLVATQKHSTLQNFRYRREYRAPAGEPGSGSNKAGRDGETIQIPVPMGTLIRDAETQELLHDFTEIGQSWVACEGGRGGKGNAHFVTAAFQAPKFAQPGEEGSSRKLTLELKLLADAGIIGFPNAGKSTLISKISAARPKVADYPFTTLIPQLGVVELAEYQTIVIADIPGLIPGAHLGAGLGHQFLKHIERTRFFIHLLDGSELLLEESASEDSNPPHRLVQRYQEIRRELEQFEPELLKKPELIVVNKIDLLQEDAQLLERAKVELKKASPGSDLFFISAVSGEGIPALLRSISARMNEYNPPVALSLPDDPRIRRK